MAWRLSKESTNAEFSNLGNIDGDDKREEVIYNARTNWELLRCQTAKTLSLTGVKPNLLLKDMKRNDIIPVPAVQDDLPLSAKAVRIPERAETKRADYSKRKTVSQVGLCIIEL